MRSKQSIAALFVVLVLLLGTTSQSVADGSWLNGDLVSWNAAGMDIPVAPGESSVSDTQLCEQFVRPAETAEDVQVAERGWLLISPYQLAWGIAVVQGFLTLDPMCRPMSFQYFVFVDGVFAGTLAPE